MLLHLATLPGFLCRRALPSLKAFQGTGKCLYRHLWPPRHKEASTANSSKLGQNYSKSESNLYPCVKLNSKHLHKLDVFFFPADSLQFKICRCIFFYTECEYLWKIDPLILWIKGSIFRNFCTANKHDDHLPQQQHRQQWLTDEMQIRKRPSFWTKYSKALPISLASLLVYCSVFSETALTFVKVSPTVPPTSWTIGRVTNVPRGRLEEFIQREEYFQLKHFRFRSVCFSSAVWRPFSVKVATTTDTKDLKVANFSIKLFLRNIFIVIFLCDIF